MELKCKVQNYEWGKIGSNSKVAQLQKSSTCDFKLNETLPYAELWMGTHINGPSVVKDTGIPLSEVISKHPEYLGDEVLNTFRGELPYLFKVLSVNKALSIQAHPSKKHAEELHLNFPDIYKDPNHKPEMAIALTPFEALCGFRPVSEIRAFIQNIPELKAIICSNISEDDSECLRRSFKNILTCDRKLVKSSMDSLLTRFKTLDENQRCLEKAELVERLHSQFPYDNGILMVYFLNYLKLQPSEAIFLAANEPHAYLFGDCIECMACSDNVVRAGLTPKFVDVETLCSMLHYKGEEPKSKLFQPIQEDDLAMIFKPPVPDFAVIKISVPNSKKNYEIPKRLCGSIIIVIDGKAQYDETQVVPGKVYFVPANNVVKFCNIQEDLLMYQAIANV